MKYSKEEIQNRALFLLKLKRENDMRYIEFCLRLMFVANSTMDAVEAKIVKYSKGEI